MHLDDGYDIFSRYHSLPFTNRRRFATSTLDSLFHRLLQGAWLYPLDASGLVFHASGDVIQRMNLSYVVTTYEKVDLAGVFQPHVGLAS